LAALVLAIVALIQTSNLVSSQNANTVLAGPPAGSAGTPGFRALALSDFPADVSFVQAFGAKCDGRTDDTAALQKADARSTGAIAVPPGSCVIARNLTLQHQLVMSPGALLSIGAGATLTLFIAPLASPQSQVFAGAGSVSIIGPLQTIYPEWWGAKADRTSNSAPAIQAAANALPFGGTIQFGRGYYKLACDQGTAVTVAHALVNLYGQGNQLTHLMPLGNCRNYLFELKPAGQSGNVRDLFFDGEDIGAPFAGQAWNAILCTQCGGNDFTNLQVYGSATFLKFDYLMGASLRNVQAQGCAVACYVFGNGPLDRAGAQHVSIVDIDYVTAFTLNTAATFTGSIAGTTLTVSAVASGAVQVGQTVNWGADTIATIVGRGTGTGGAGTYTIDAPQSVASTTIQASAGIGMIFDSGASEISIRRYLNGGMIGGVLIQNSAAAQGGHRPEGIRFFDGTNLSANINYAMSVQSGFSIENYGTSFNGTTAGPGAIVGPASGPSTVDRFTIIGGEATGNARDNVLIQSACNVAIRSAAAVGASVGAINKYSAIHATPAACGALEVTGNTLGGAVYGNFANGQAFAVQLDQGSYANQTVGGLTFIGRINIQMNLVQGNQSGGINNAGAVPTGVNLLIANQL
jgi:hypothetical protein